MRYLTAEEANALLPRIREILDALDGHIAAGREARALLDDLTAYWGPAVREADHPEHGEHLRLQARLQDAQDAADACLRRLHDLGAHLKSLEAGLLDFYALREGRPVFLCWQRGEEAVAHYHELEAGFAGRKPLARP